ncbi:MAG: DUF2321 domain-containing protein [Acidobacteria bacterium]|nr:MAG: DUF2321 domain-containing protein [Acidobacteriota bacterium]
MHENWYDTAQICLNGHIANARWVSRPQHNQDFCTKCGAKTIINCVACESPIRGYYHIPGVAAPNPRAVPAYCYNCGKAYPWTEAALKAARDLSDDLDGLSKEEKDKLKGTLDDLVKDSPQTAVAAGRFERLLSKAGKSASESFRQILVDVVSETAKKIIFPDR